MASSGAGSYWEIMEDFGDGACMQCIVNDWHTLDGYLFVNFDRDQFTILMVLFLAFFYLSVCNLTELK